MKDKIILYYSFFTLISAFILVTLFLFWIVYPYEPIKIKNDPFPVLQKEIKAGETLTYTVDYCKKYPYEALVTRTYEDGIEYSVVANSSNKSVGCHKINVEILTPKTLPPSTYWLEIRFSYKVNPIKTIDVLSRTQSFKIVK